MAHYSGVDGDVTVGATAMEVVEWTATLNRAVIDVTTKADSGYQTLNADGKKSCSINVTAVWDDSNTVHTGSAGVPAIWADSSVSVTLELGDASSSISGTFVVESVEYSNPDGENANMVTFTANSSGTFYAPGQPTS